jgi:hypothetical protein
MVEYRSLRTSPPKRPIPSCLRNTCIWNPLQIRPWHTVPAWPNIKPITDPSNPCANQEGVTCKNLGTEEVNGRTCDHWQMTDKNGKVSNSWIDQKLHFPIKTTSTDSSWELTNIKEGQPEASLFEIPAGYHKMDMGQLMQGMQGMHPPQE